MQAILDEFVKKLEGYLGVTREVISIADIWEKNPPPQGKGKTLEEFLSKVCRISIAMCLLLVNLDNSVNRQATIHSTMTDITSTSSFDKIIVRSSEKSHM